MTLEQVDRALVVALYANAAALALFLVLGLSLVVRRVRAARAERARLEAVHASSADRAARGGMHAPAGAPTSAQLEANEKRWYPHGPARRRPRRRGNR